MSRLKFRETASCKMCRLLWRVLQFACVTINNTTRIQTRVRVKYTFLHLQTLKMPTKLSHFAYYKNLSLFINHIVVRLRTERIGSMNAPRRLSRMYRLISVVLSRICFKRVCGSFNGKSNHRQTIADLMPYVDMFILFCNQHNIKQLLNESLWHKDHSAMQTNWGLTIKALLFPTARENLVQVGHEFRTNISHLVRNTHEVKFHLVSKKCRPICFLMAILKMTEF